MKIKVDENNMDENQGDYERNVTSDICKTVNEFAPPNLEHVLARVSQAKSAAADVQVRGDTEKGIGEDKVKSSLEARNDQITAWLSSLRNEINKLVDEFNGLKNCLDDALKNYHHFLDIEGISKTCLESRSSLECGNAYDSVNVLLQNEASVAEKAAQDTFHNMNRIQEFLRRLVEADRDLRTQSELKSFANNCVKLCEHVKPFLSRPYLPGEVMKPYHEDTEVDWEKRVREKIQISMALRMEAKDCCAFTIDSIERHMADLLAAWGNTTQALEEEVFRDEKILNFTRDIIRRMDKEINASKLRSSIFHNEFDREMLEKRLEAWRLQQLNYRAHPENIRDQPVQKLETEMREIQKRLDKITVEFESDQKLAEDLFNFRAEQMRKMDIITKRLFADKESCLGLRKTVKIDYMKI